MKNSRLGLKVTAELRQKLEMKATELKLSISDLIRLCIESYFEKGSTHFNGSSTREFESRSTWFNELVQEKDDRVSDLKREIEEKNKQIEEFQKQQDQAQQIIAMQQKNIDRLTEQNHLLLEASQEKEAKKVGFWGRLVGQRA